MKVLIALDESPVSSRAARVAARLFPQADVDFLAINVARIPMPWVGAAGFGVVAPVVADPAWLEPDEGTEADLMARAKDAGVRISEALVTSGDPVTAICAAAEEHDVDVIVVGSHDKSALRRLFDPSVASGIVRETYRPVLVVSGAPPAESPAARDG